MGLQFPANTTPGATKQTPGLTGPTPGATLPTNGAAQQTAGATLSASPASHAATQVPTPSPANSSKPSPGGGVPVLLTLVFVLAALAAGLVLGRRKRPAGGPPPAPVGLPDIAGTARADWDRASGNGTGRSKAESAVIAERARLVESCADLADRLREHQPALYTVLTRDLAAVGVTFRIPDGEPFDSQGHRAVDSEATSDQAADMRVAATVRAGYADHGTVVRVPDVIIYRATGNGNAG
jgi:hypothetical protein